jgi:DNA polymerase-1
VFEPLPSLMRFYRHVVVVDFEFEFGNVNGNQPRPVCAVAKDLATGMIWRLWRDELVRMRKPPWPIGDDTLCVAFMSSAEWNCYKALGWPMPSRVLDLWVEFKNATNGRWLALSTASLVSVLDFYRIDSISAHEKKEMVNLILSGGPWIEQQKLDILNYCESDIIALERLLPAMLPHIDLSRALLRGRFMVANASIEFAGTPIDTLTLSRLRQHWTDMQDALIAAIDKDYNVFDGRSFRAGRFEAFLVRNNIPWPRLESGALDLSSATFRQMVKIFPIVAPLHELRHSLSDLRLNDLRVGEDGRNRCVLWAFASRTSRSQPSNSQYIYGPSVWLRSLVKPAQGFAIAVIDWVGQEFGIGAALSNDERMWDAYNATDIYIGFGQQCGKLPPDATKTSHKRERNLFKQCVLGVQFGMQARTLAHRIEQPQVVARELLWLHHDTFRKFWRFSDAAVDTAMLGMPLQTVFGWTLRLNEKSKPLTFRNFPMQANGAEMMRLACCLAVERGLEVISTIHDAIAIHAPADRIDEDVAAMRACMAEASRIVLGGLELRTEAKIVRWPDRYKDVDRGLGMWARVLGLLDGFDRAAGVA